jgi:hypothetical protein
VHEQAFVDALLDADLADRLEERLRFDVADRSADFDERDVVTLRRLVDAVLDLVGDVRNDLDGRAEIVAARSLRITDS